MNLSTTAVLSKFARCRPVLNLGVMPLFDGLARVLSTCRRCGEPMIVLDADATVHPCCEPKPTRVESLTQGWLSTVLAGDKQAETLTATEIVAHEQQPPQLARAAAYYARWGWRVFPLGMHKKRPGIPSAHPEGDPLRGICKGECGRLGHGLHDATTDVEQIGRWWKTNYNIGLATGHHFDVIDVDVKSGGVQSFLKLLEKGSLPEVHGVAATASGGMHLYVKPTGRGNHAKVRPGIDYRGRGGYCVAPPSTLGIPGRSYSWMTMPSPEIKK